MFYGSNCNQKSQLSGILTEPLNPRYILTFKNTPVHIKIMVKCTYWPFKPHLYINHGSVSWINIDRIKNWRGPPAHIAQAGFTNLIVHCCKSKRIQPYSHLHSYFTPWQPLYMGGGWLINGHFSDFCLIFDMNIIYCWPIHWI